MIEPGDLSAHDCLLFNLAGYRSRWRFRRKSSKPEHNPVIEVPVQGSVMISNALSLRACALAGMGPALLADWLVVDDLTAGRLIDLYPGYQVTATEFETAAWLVYPSRAYLPAKVRAGITFLDTHLAKKSQRD